MGIPEPKNPVTIGVQKLARGKRLITSQIMRRFTDKWWGGYLGYSTYVPIKVVKCEKYWYMLIERFLQTKFFTKWLFEPILRERPVRIELEMIIKYILIQTQISSPEHTWHKNTRVFF